MPEKVRCESAVEQQSDSDRTGINNLEPADQSAKVEPYGTQPRQRQCEETQGAPEKDGAPRPREEEQKGCGGERVELGKGQARPLLDRKFAIKLLVRADPKPQPIITTRTKGDSTIIAREFELTTHAGPISSARDVARDAPGY
jgi:hypothetical protein